MNWARDKFTTFEFSIGDTLQVHNYCAFGHPTHGLLSYPEALRISAQEGRQWRAENEAAIAAMLPIQKVKFLHWEEWKAHRDFRPVLQLYTDLIMSDPTLRDILLNEVRNFSSRRMSRSVRSDDPRVRRAADFVLEELAIYHIHSNGYPVFHIYPGGELQIMMALRKHRLTPTALRQFDFINLQLEPGDDTREGDERRG